MRTLRRLGVGWTSGAATLLTTSLTLPLSFALVGALTLPGLYIGAALADAAPPLHMMARTAIGALRDQGVDPATVSVRLACDPSCTAPGGRITVDVSTRVTLPFLPDVLGPVAGVPVRATHVAPLDRYAA